MRSSKEARDLIRAAIKYAGSERAAARLLRISTQAALNKMLHGLIRDTPEMIAALQRAELRARRAYLFVKADQQISIDREQIIGGINTTRNCLENFLAMLPDLDPSLIKERL